MVEVLLLLIIEQVYKIVINNIDVDFFKNNEKPHFYYTNLNIKNKIPQISSKVKVFKDKIATIDIETYLDDNVHKILSICFFDGKFSKSFYITDYHSDEAMIIAFFRSVITLQYNSYNFLVGTINHIIQER